ncbi:MAG: DUF481 domain-containing protein [Verrucomicrobiota bacterium]|jgi:putative salt-induced outer membrane protein YdiY|nr:DUF481 domain-containing protein [Verrucomicrobiota bacterium]
MTKIRFFSLLAFFLAALQASAQVASGGEASTPPKPAFTTTISLGTTYTEGNSDTAVLNLRYATEGQKERLGTLTAKVEANYGENRVDGLKDTITENFKASLNIKKDVGRWYISGDTSYFYDDIALVDYRILLGPGVGRRLLQSDAQTLTVETGPSYLWERVDGIKDDYVALRLAENYAWQISATAKFHQSLEYLPKVDDFENYLLHAEVGIETAINEWMNLALIVQDKYDNIPAAGTEHNDLSIIASLGISF